MTIEEKEKVYAQHIANAYLDPDDRVDPGVVLELKKRNRLVRRIDGYDDGHDVDN